MTKPSDYQLSTDYATIKNDGYNNTLTVTVPSSQSVTANGIWNISQTVTIGSQSSNIRARIRSSKDLRWISSPAVNIGRTGTISGTPAPYSIIVTITRQTETSVRITATILNPYNVTLIGASGSEVMNGEVSTFLSPFS